jgi:hypothetical protein
MKHNSQRLITKIYLLLDHQVALEPQLLEVLKGDHKDLLVDLVCRKGGATNQVFQYVGIRLVYQDWEVRLTSRRCELRSPPDPVTICIFSITSKFSM